MDYWYVYNRKNNLFWNNEAGWGHLATATRFTEREKETFNLPLDGQWMHATSHEAQTWSDPDI